MKKRRKISSQELGLGIGLVVGRHFFGIEDLHYGYWTSDLPVDISHLPRAQEQYSDFVISHIPHGVTMILDVGCGIGRVAKRLMDRGFQVDCVSPSPFLTQFARGVLGGDAQVFECPFEELTTPRRYDLILFSESFQYVPLEIALTRSVSLLEDQGYLLICDFFRKEGDGKSPLGGGQRLVKFYETVARLPLDRVEDIDITKETAPTLQLVNDAFMNAVGPAWRMVSDSVSVAYPLLSKLLRWKFRRKIEKLERKHFSGSRTPESFETFKSYRLLLYRKRAGERR